MRLHIEESAWVAIGMIVSIATLVLGFVQPISATSAQLTFKNAYLFEPSTGLYQSVVGSFTYDQSTNVNITTSGDEFWPSLTFTSPATYINPNTSTAPGIIVFEFDSRTNGSVGSATFALSPLDRRYAATYEKSPKLTVTFHL